MPITSVTSDPEALTLTIVGDYTVPLERLWQAWVDPRQIERFWGPPEWPATFTRHELVEGGRSDYVMTGPDGATSAGSWIVTACEPGRSFSTIDRFVGDDGEVNDDMPSMTMQMQFESTSEGSRFTSITTFTDLASMEQLVEMGMIEGSKAAMGQMDAVLADLASFAADRATEAKVLNDTQVRFSRIIGGSVEQVWRAHHDPELMRRWMLGPGGWSLPVCEPANEVGEAYRYVWSSADGSESFGFEGTVLESAPPHREVSTEAMIGMDFPPATNEMTLAALDAGTLLTVVVTYPDAATRDGALGSGMVDGMEDSYARLESLVLV